MDKPIKVLVTGGQGQLGLALQAETTAFSAIALLVTDIADLDICDSTAVDAFFTEHKPDVVINCAAYTAVDKAETEPQLAFRINEQAVAILAKACMHHAALLLHISTDYVFSGAHYLPYQEMDAVAPASVYGASKLAGEQALLRSGVAGAIIRTSWLYSEFGGNFVKTMLRLASTRDVLGVVADQIGSPTYARDLANALLQIIATPKCKEALARSQVWHYCNQGVASWYDFAKAIFSYSGHHCLVNPLTTAEYPTAAKRPVFSVLDTHKVQKAFAIHIPYWRDSLALCLQRISSETTV